MITLAGVVGRVVAVVAGRATAGGSRSRHRARARTHARRAHRRRAARRAHRRAHHTVVGAHVSGNEGIVVPRVARAHVARVSVRGRVHDAGTAGRGR